MCPAGESTAIVTRARRGWPRQLATVAAAVLFLAGWELLALGFVGHEFPSVGQLVGYLWIVLSGSDSEADAPIV